MPYPTDRERDRPWVIRTYAGHSSAEKTNELYRRNLSKGQTGLSVAFDLPTLMGRDSDDPHCVGEVGHCGVAIDSAAEAFKTWRKSLPRPRRDILLKAAEVMERRKEELGGYMMNETGCPRQWADFNVTAARELILDVAGRLGGLDGSMPTAADPNTGAMILREPFGVILAIAPW